MIMNMLTNNKTTIIKMVQIQTTSIFPKMYPKLSIIQLIKIIMIYSLLLLFSKMVTVVSSSSFDLVSGVSVTTSGVEAKQNNHNRRGNFILDHMIAQHRDLLSSYKFPVYNDNKNNDLNEQQQLSYYYHHRNMITTTNVSIMNVAAATTTTTTTATKCIRNQMELEISINNVPNASLIPTTINICKEYMNINASILNNITGERGIHIMNKNINFRCVININKKCILDANYISRHFTIQNSIIQFQRIILMNGYVTNVTNDHYETGGSILLISNVTITFNQCNMINNIVFADNNEVGLGGCIYCENNCNITLRNVNMMNNIATGGAISFGGAIASFGTNSNLIMTNVIFTNNNAAVGGAIVSGGGTVQMTNVSFINNTADVGGAIHSGLNNITLTNVTTINNNAYVYGGAIYLEKCYYAEIMNSTFINNSALDVGGGAIFSARTALVLGNIFGTNNSAGNVCNQEGTLVLANSKVDLKNIFLSSSIVDADSCDIIIVASEGEEDRLSRLNLRSSPPPRTQQRKQQEIFVISNATTQPFPTIRQQQQQQQQPICVTTYMAFKKQVRLCNSNRCDINICSAQIKMKNILRGSYHPIDLSNKTIEINCQIYSSNYEKRCTIDGQGLSSIFSGSNVNVTIRNIIFANGYSSDNHGGAGLNLDTDSIVRLFNCSFVNNSAAHGGAAIMISNSALYMTGTQSSFINNTGNKSPLVAHSSDLNVHDALFEGNSMTKYGNGIFLFKSTIDLYNATFSVPENTPVLEPPETDCNIFVAVDQEMLSNGATCLDVNSVTK